MSDELNSQLSAFVDNELSPEESELLVRRLCRDDSLRHIAAAYGMIGDAMRDDVAVTAPADFASRVMMAVEGQRVRATAPQARPVRSRAWGMAIAASVVLAAVALMTLPQRDAGVPVAVVADSTPPPAVLESDSFPVGSSSNSLMAVMPSVDDVAPASFNVPMVIPAARQSAENRTRLNKYLLLHVNSAGAPRQGMATFRNVGFVTQTEAER